MESQTFETSLRSFMTALFVGIFNALTCLIYNVIYRGTQREFDSTLLNVSYIIFGMLFIFSMVGLVYLLVLRILPKGDLIFSLLMAVLTIGAILGIRSANLSSDAIENGSLRSEYTGVLIISGIYAAIITPILHRSPKFAEYVV